MRTWRIRCKRTTLDGERCSHFTANDNQDCGRHPGSGNEADERRAASLEPSSIGPYTPDNPMPLSDLKVFAQCPRRWSYDQQEYTESLAEVDTTAMEVGAEVHEAFDVLHRGGTPVVFSDEARKIVDAAADWDAASPTRDGLQDSSVFVEGEINGVPLRTKVDAVTVDEDGRVWVEDYKTSKSAPFQRLDDAGEPLPPDGSRFVDGIIQAELYRQHFGTEVSGVRHLYLRQKRVAEITVGDTAWEQAETSADQIVQGARDRMDYSFGSGEFPARPAANMCGRCEYRNRCPDAVEKLDSNLFQSSR